MNRQKAFFINGLLIGIIPALLLGIGASTGFLEKMDPWGSALLLFAVIFVLYSIFTIKSGREMRHQMADIASFIKILSAGKFSQRIAESGSSESFLVEHALNQLAARLERQVADLQRLASEKESLANQAGQAAVIEERQRLARDLHDAVSQQLFALNMLASAAARSVEKQPAVAKKQLAEVAEMAKLAQGEMRALLLHLRPVHLNQQSLTEGLKQLLDELKSKTKMRFKTKIDDLGELNKGIENQLFRLIQESLSNALRHSEGSEVEIELFKTSAFIVLSVKDDGVGFDPAADKKASYGLKTMQERATQLGGQLTVTSKKQAGTHITVRIPYGLED